MDAFEAELTRIRYQLPARFQQRLRGIPPPGINADVFGYGRWYASFGEFCRSELQVTVPAGVFTELSAMLCSKHAIRCMMKTTGIKPIGVTQWYMAFDVEAEESDALVAEIMRPLLPYALHEYVYKSFLAVWFQHKLQHIPA